MLSKNIRELRINSNMSQEALAEKLGVSRQMVSRWETEGAYPKSENLINMAKLFNVSLDFLTDNNSVGKPKGGIQAGSDALDGIIKDIEPTHMQRIREAIKKNISADSYRVWFKPLLPVRIDEAEECIFFMAENDFAEKVIKNRYISMMEDCVEMVYGVRYKVCISSAE